MILNNRHEGFAFRVGHYLSDDRPAPFHDSEDGGFRGAPSAFALHVVPRIPADVAFICFRDGVEWLVVFLHRLTDLVAHPQSRWIAHAQFPLDLFRCHPGFRLAELEDDVEPIRQRDFGVVEDGASGRVGLRSALLARVALARCYQVMTRDALTRFAGDAVGPTEPNEISEALFGRAVVLQEVSDIEGNATGCVRIYLHFQHHVFQWVTSGKYGVVVTL